MRYCTIRDYRLYLKSFKKSLLANTMAIYWQGTLISIKLKSLLAENTTGRILERMLRSISKAATFIWF